MSVEVPTWEEFDESTKRADDEINALKAQNSVLDDEVSDLHSEILSLRFEIDALRALVEPPVPVVPKWFDEFAGTAVDTAKWNVRNNTYASNEESIVTSRPTNVVVKDDTLTIRAQKETYKIPGGITQRNFTSGYLDSKGKGSWTYGRFEIRAKLPTAKGDSKGMWPAFWLRPDDGGNGEIDIMEALGSGATGTEFNKVHFAIHHDYLPSSNSAHIVQQNKTLTLPAPQTTADGFHVYAINWTADAIVWFVDGVEVFRRDTTTTPWFAEVFRKPYHIRLNLQVGGTWAGSPDAATVFPGDYVVDYVKVFQD